MDCRNTVNYKMASLILEKDLVFPRNSIRELHSRYHLLQKPFSWIKGEERYMLRLSRLDACMYLSLACLLYPVIMWKMGLILFIMVIYNSCKKIKHMFPVSSGDLKKNHLFFHEGMKRYCTLGLKFGLGNNWSTYTLDWEIFAYLFQRKEYKYQPHCDY